MMMDVQTGVFCAVFSVLAALIVYAILSFYSIKGDSFDEAKANRRKLLKEYLDNRPNNEKAKQKKPKKIAKKVKDKKIDPLPDSEVVKEGVESESSQEVLSQPKEAVDFPKKTDQVKPVTSSKVVKSQQSEKDESSNQNPVTTSDNNQTKKVAEKKVKAKIPERKIEAESAVQSNSAAILKEVEKKVEKKIDVKNEKPEKKVEIKTEKVEKKVENKNEKLEKKVEVKIEKKIEDKNVKKKNEQPTVLNTRKQTTGNDKQFMNVNTILSIIQKAELARSEIQLLIDTLLNSEDETSDWLKVKKLESGKQDNCVKLKKQLSDVELSLKNEKQITSSLQSKLKEVRTEMATDKSSLSSMKETFTKLQQDRDELVHEKTDLSFKLKTVTDEKNELQEQLNKESAKAQQLQKLEDDHHDEAVQALKEELSGVAGHLEAVENENISLKSTISCLEGELNLHQNCHEKVTGLEQALSVYSEKLKEKDSEVLSLKNQVETLLANVSNLKKENIALSVEKKGLSNKVTAEMERLKEEVDTLTAQLSAKENNDHAQENGDVSDSFESVNYQELLEEKDKDILQLTEQSNDHLKVIGELQFQLSVANKEKDELKYSLGLAESDLSTIKESFVKFKGSNGENEKLIEALKANVQELNVKIESYRAQIDALNLKIKTVEDKPGSEKDSSDSESLKFAVEELKAQAASERKSFSDKSIELLNSNNTLKSSLDQANAELTKLKGEVQALKINNSQKEDLLAQFQGNQNSSVSEIKTLRDDLEKYKQRNNELRNKNWKVVQALSDAEKALQSKLKSEEHGNGNNVKSVEELKSSVNTFVQRLFPDLEVKENKGHFNEWLSSVEDAVLSNMRQKTKTNHEDPDSEIVHLQSLVKNYQKIISDTERILNELQNQVEDAESKWRKKEYSYQKEIENLRALNRC